MGEQRENMEEQKERNDWGRKIDRDRHMETETKGRET